MQMIEVSHPQLTSLPLPSPTLVIDTRGVEDDNVMDRLKIEIADLANEMKTQDIHHWRYLTEFLSFWLEEPMTADEVKILRPQNQNNSHNSQPAGTSPSGDVSTSTSAKSGLTGKIDPSTLKGYTPPFFFQKVDDIAPLTENGPDERLQQDTQKFVQEIDRLRNNRHVAVADLEKSMSGRSVKDATVRVLFLTDAERPDSLATTAIYAAHLKAYYAKKGRPGQQPLISTTALCLNNSGEATPSTDLKELLWDDGWEHLDALILTEDYRQDAAQIAGAIQTYLAELLLYVLMIVPPMAVESASQAIRTSNTSTDSHTPSSSQDTNSDKKGRNIPFPPNTFLVGLAAMEHSARWGRRLLNYKVVERAIEVIQRGAEGERSRAKNIATSWLNNWRALVKNAIPDKVPGNIAALQAIHQAAEVIKPADKVFTLKTLSLNIGKSTITDLEAYLNSLTQTYNLEHASEEAGSTLQEAIDSIPHIQLRLREWESKDPALRKGTPLVNAQVEAQRVLSNKDFFTGASGAIPRAGIQLEALSNAIANFRSEHQENIDLSKKCEDLKNKGKNMIDALQNHIQSMPFLSAVLHLKQFMAWITFFIALFLSLIATFAGIAWLRHFINYYNTHGAHLALPDLTPILNNALFLSASPLAIVFWLLVLGIVLAMAIVFGRKLLIKKERSDFNVEVIFWLSLIVFALSGLLISFSLVELAGDLDSLSIIGWLSFLPTLGAIFFIIALVIALVEIVYFIWWYLHLQEERARIVNELDEEHKKNIDAVARHIADSIALHLLQRTGLTSEKGGPGEYFQRINQLNMWLKDILENAQKQQRLARKRLLMSVSETQPGIRTGSQDIWLNLGIRHEYLDVDMLADGYNRLTERLGQEIEELKEFSELLLRVMGEESVAEIEQQFRERTPSQGSIEQHNFQILMTALVAMALRLSINATSIYSMNPLIQQYDSVANSFTHQPIGMKTLIESLRKKVRQNMLQPVIEGRLKQSEAEKNALATNAFAAWGQMLWEGKDPELDRTLSPEGVLPKLVEEDYNAHMVKRLLGLRTSLFGRNTEPGQLGALYLLIPPSPQTHQFSQDLNLPKRHIIDFPDVERLLLLYVQHYVSEPLFLPEPDKATSAGASADGAVGQSAQNGVEADAVAPTTPTQAANGSSPEHQGTGQTGTTIDANA